MKVEKWAVDVSCLALLVLLLPLFSSCQTDSYDKGEGELSLTQADFVEAHADGSKRIDRVLTDDGQELTLQTPAEAKWITTADSVYRAVLYYNKVEGTPATVVPVALSAISTLSLHPAEYFKEGVKTDPVTFESMWKSRNGRYVNIGMYLKVGKTDSDEKLHRVGMVLEGIVTHPDRRTTACLRFYHDQGGVPEYYSSKCYVSIPCQEITADSVCVTLNTYGGTVTRRFCLNP